MFIQAFDDDSGFSSPDYLDDIFINLDLQVGAGFTSSRTFSGSRVSIQMRFRVDCLQNFYGPDCSVPCVAQNDNVNGHFVCDQNTGSRVCLPNFYGPNCLTFCLASSNAINGFYTCNPNDGSRICNEGFANPDNFCTQSEYNIT